VITSEQSTRATSAVAVHLASATRAAVKTVIPYRLAQARRIEAGGDLLESRAMAVVANSIVVDRTDSRNEKSRQADATPCAVSGTRAVSVIVENTIYVESRAMQMPSCAG
jgi:hypothetical protein